MKKVSYGLGLFVFLFTLSVPAGFCADSALIQQLAARMDALEQSNHSMAEELAVVKSENQGLRQAINILKNEISPDGTYVVPKDAAYKGKNMMTTADPNFVKMYGFIKADVIYNDSQSGELGLNAPREGTARGEDDEMHLNARDTRFGFDINGPTFAEDGKVKGKIEVDFWGSNTGDGDNSPNPRIRQAYVDLLYRDWDLRAGQAWDFFAPLNPTTLNFGILWRAGNMGDRHPQVVVGRQFDNVFDGKLKAKAGFLEASDLDANNGWPVLGGYVSYENKIFDRPYYVGIGGIYGEQDAAATISKDTRIWGYTLAFKLDLMDNLAIKGEGYFGAGLANFRAGSPTGVITNSDDPKAVRSKGGWLQAVYTPFDRWELSAGLGVDDVWSDGTGTATIWDYNYSHIYGVRYRIAKGLYGGFEYQRIGTKYKQQDGGELSRFMTSLIYKF